MAIVFGIAVVVSLGFSLVRTAFGAPLDLTTTVTWFGFFAIFFMMELYANVETARFDAILREREKRDVE
jgi:hypothetical protein